MTVPESVELWGLPQDSVTEVPATTSYKFLLNGRTIAVVDPDSRKVIQIIPNRRAEFDRRIGWIREMIRDVEGDGHGTP